jgi:hypothetical protein
MRDLACFLNLNCTPNLWGWLEGCAFIAVGGILSFTAMRIGKRL